jgi:hypothetical protein
MLVPAPLKCPISLDVPVCAHITPCGHVFGFPAIMGHLLRHGGSQLRVAAPCPLCFHAIAARELRLLHATQVRMHRVRASPIRQRSAQADLCACAIACLTVNVQG